MDIGISKIAAHPGGLGLSATGGPTEALVERFNRLMESAPAPQAAESGMPTVLTQFVRDQQALYTQIGEKTLAVGQAADSMNLAQLAVRQIELMQAVGRAQTQFTAVTAIAQGAKSGLQTLMKNQ